MSELFNIDKNYSAWLKEIKNKRSQFATLNLGGNQSIQTIRCLGCGI